MTTILVFPTASPSSTPKWQSTCRFIIKKAKEIVIIALKVLVLVALALWQAECFLAGFLTGFIIKAIFREKCTESIRKVKEVVAKRPCFIAFLAITTAIIIPGSVLVIPPFLGGFYGGVKTVDFCLAAVDYGKKKWCCS